MTSYEDLAEQPLGDNILSQIAATARDIRRAEQDVVEAEEALKEAKAALRALQEVTMPELMAEAGQRSLTTIDGLKVEVKEMVRGQPSKENLASALQWLRENGHGGIIKTQIEADLGRGDPKVVSSALEALSGVGVTAVPSQGVHWQTLGALVRELLAAGKPVPLDILGVVIWRQANIK